MCPRQIACPTDINSRRRTGSWRGHQNLRPLIIIDAALIIGIQLALFAVSTVARADDATLHLAFESCGRDHDIQACDDLVARSDLDAEQHALAYAARGIARLALTDVDGARADLAKAQALDRQNDEVEILRDKLSDLANDPYKKLLFHCLNMNEKAVQKRVQACTQLINLPPPRHEPPANDYALRSKAYFDFGDFADARADLLKAQQLDATSFFFRRDYIIATYGSGDYQAALTETEAAMTKLPYPSGELMLIHGQLAYLMGKDDKAITDFQALLKLSPSDLGANLWLNLVRVEQHKDVSKDTQQLLTKIDANGLGVAPLQFQFGKIDTQTLLDKADHAGFEQKPARLCVAYFNIGHKAWLAGDIAGARQDFRQALQTNKYGLIEYQASKILLQKLGG